MSLRVTFGVDPGLSGALATLIDGVPGPMLDMPVCDLGKGREVDAFALSRFIRSIRAANQGAVFEAAIEQVRAMPSTDKQRRKMGAQTSFNFGDSFGQVKAVFRALGMTPACVEAQTWKRRAGLIGTEKDAARILAITRFQEAEPMLKRKKDSGRADALWIALWCDSAAMGAKAA